MGTRDFPRARQNSGVFSPELLLWARFGRHHPVDPVIDDQLAVVFARVLDQAVGQIGQPVLPGGSRILDDTRHSRVALGFNQVGAVFHALSHKRYHLGLSL